MINVNVMTTPMTIPAISPGGIPPLESVHYRENCKTKGITMTTHCLIRFINYTCGGCCKGCHEGIFTICRKKEKKERMKERRDREEINKERKKERKKEEKSKEQRLLALCYNNYASWRVKQTPPPPPPFMEIEILIHVIFNT